MLTDDDPHRCCTECRAALWPGGVFAVPGAGGDLRVVVAKGRVRRLEAAVTEVGDLVLSWRGPRPGEKPVVVEAADTGLLGAVLVSALMGNGRRLMSWLERLGLDFVGELDGPAEECTFTGDGQVTFAGRGGSLLVHAAPDRFLLQLVAYTYRDEGYRSIAEFHGWLSGFGLDIARVG